MDFPTVSEVLEKIQDDPLRLKRISEQEGTVLGAVLWYDKDGGRKGSGDEAGKYCKNARVLLRSD